MKKLPFDKLLIATGNRHKFSEIKDMLSPFGIEAIPAFNYDIKEPKETGSTFEENALIKAKYYSEALDMPALADDSGLCVEALDGAPGIYSARWAKEFGEYDGVIKEIQKRLKIGKTKNYNALFVCNIAIYNLDEVYAKKIHNFEGKVEGALQFPSKGCNGFGYDPIFVPKRYNITFGEMNPEEKKKISHRANAMNKFIEWIQNFS